MKYALVTPPDGFRAVEDLELGFHLVLAQELLRDDEYREYYRSLHRSGHFIVCDNGAAESDQPPFDEVVKVANYIGADEIVLPDVIRDFDGTLNALDDWAHVWEKIPIYQRFVVPQGSSITEWFSCLDLINRGVRFATLGVSKYAPVPREQLLPRCLGPWNVHLLGIVGQPVPELARLRQGFPWVRSVDSGAPVAWAQAGALISTDPPPDAPRYSLVWDEPFDWRQAAVSADTLVMAANEPLTRLSR